ncbi:MAG: enoyl-CoA hydratase/isomerase family protein [Dehalococcoidia bacterium]|nr:enoyl-CoA hydratase/isomerase family protein [Dehalococcoidia bacterium]
MPHVTVSLERFVATLTLDAPGGLVTRAFTEDVAAAASDVAALTDEVHAVIITSAGPDLAVGWGPDLLDGGAAAVAGLACDAIAAIPQPTIAVIEGRALSAGLELALAADVRFASTDARFGLADVAEGRVPRGGGTQRLPRAVGRAHALRLLLLAEEVDASEAQRIGLVSRVLPSKELLPTARATAEAIAARGPIATRFAKEAVHRGVEMPLQQALRYELDLTVILQTTADRAEGVRAFAERRPPEFTGR